MSTRTVPTTGPLAFPFTDRPPGPPLLKRIWRALPVSLRLRVVASIAWTGLPLLVNFLASYRRRHAPELFAGNLAALHAAYATAPDAERPELLRRFDAIADAIVVSAGVRKTTYADRPTRLLDRILADPACALPVGPLRVLDLPASTGAASLGARALLASRRPIAEYALADLSFHLLLDRERDCVFDAARRLLQVRTIRGFASTELPHTAGEESSALTRLALAPLAARGERLRRSLRADDARVLEYVPLLRPDVLERARGGEFVHRELDVFAPIPGIYDLILSFNLLQRNYFTADRIAEGRRNLGGALAPGGLLILGRPDADGTDVHEVYRRDGEHLALVRAEGTL